MAPAAVSANEEGESPSSHGYCEHIWIGGGLGKDGGRCTQKVNLHAYVEELAD